MGKIKDFLALATDQKMILVLFGLILLLRLSFILIMGPMPQDAYYFFYSQHLALSYFDHPPMVAYMLRLFTSLLGNNIIAIKIADTTVTFLTILAFYHLAKCFLSGKQVRNAIVLFVSTFMVAILSLVSTPDVPLMLFWAISLNFLYQALFNKRPLYWLLAGIAMGLAFDSKYTAVFIPAGLILFLLLSKAQHHHFRSRWFWLAVLAFLITITPVVIWNAGNNFASFRFQSTGRMQATTGPVLQLKSFFGLLGHQLLVLTPIVFGALVYLMFRLFRRLGRKTAALPAEQVFLLCFFLPLVFCFTVISFFSWVKLNWMMPAYISGIIWASLYIPQKWIGRQVVFSFLLHMLIAVEIIFYPVPIQSDDTWFGWNELGTKVEQLKKDYPDAFVFSADGYKTSAELNLAVPGFTYSQNVIGENALQFDYVNNNLSDLKGRNAIFIDSDPRFTNDQKENRANPTLKRYFKSVRELAPILIEKNGEPVRKFLVYYCTDYK